MLPRAVWLAVALVLGLAATFVGHAHHTLGLGLSALALVALLPAVWEPETGLAFLLAYMPFRTLIATASPLPLHFVADVVVFTLALRVLILHPRTVLGLNAIEVWGLAFIVIGLVATVHAHVRVGGALLEIRDLFLFWLLYASVRRLVASGDGPSADFWPRAVPIAIAAIAVVGLQGLIGMATGHGQHFLLPGPWQTEPISAVNRGRPYGLVNNPNIFGELGAIALVLTYARFRASGLRPLPLVLVLCGFFLAMVLFSYSRTAWIVAGVAMVVYFIAARGAGERVGVFLAALLLAVGIVGQPHAKHRAVTATARTTIRHSAKAGRLETLRLAASLARHRPLGTGLGTFGSGAARVFHQSAPGVPHRFYADDNYAALLIETGPVGLLLFLLMGLSVFLRVLRAHAPPDDRLGVFVLFLALALIAGTSNGFEQLNLTVYPWLALGVLTSEEAGRLALGRLGPRLRLRGV